MLCVIELATCLCIRAFLVLVVMRRNVTKRPRIGGLFFVGRLCLRNQNVMCI